MKSLIIAGLLISAASAAQAGPYANVETNSGCPALLAPDGEDGDVELSGKAGGSYGINEALSVYGEFSFLTGDTNGYGTKAGLKYNF